MQWRVQCMTAPLAPRGPAAAAGGVAPSSSRRAREQWRPPAPSRRSGQQPRSPGDIALVAQQQAAAARVEQPSPLPSTASLLRFERQGHLLTRRLLPRELVTHLAAAAERVVTASRLDALRHRVRVLAPDAGAAALRSEAAALAALSGIGEPVGFLQFFNSHVSDPDIAAAVRHPALAGTAAALLGVPRVRLYQDCLFLKEPGYGETNWHSDLRMAPLDTNAFVTAWLPLRAIAREHDSGLVFAAGSHRDFALPFWHDDLEGRDLSDRGYEIASTGAMQLGDVSWHHGWTLHGAAPQPRRSPRRLALTISFFADGAKTLAKSSGSQSVRKGRLHDEDAESYSSWLRDIGAGAPAVHARLPLVWPTQTSRPR